MQSLTPYFYITTMKMKSIIFLTSIAIIMLMNSCNSCSYKDKNKRHTVEDVIKDNTPVTEMKVSGADTAAIMNQVNEFTSHLKQNNVEAAMRMVKYLDGDTIKPTPQYLQKRERMVLGTVLGATRYEIQNITLLSEKDCEVRIMVTLFDLPQGDTRPNQVGLIVKPVRRSGNWFLTLADTDSQTNNSKIVN